MSTSPDDWDEILIRAPCDGWCAPLDEVPDPVFAQRMLGDGLSIDPISGVVHAPCDGEVVTLPASAHAVSIRAAAGIEVLIHVGIDTVQLGGRGFEPRVAVGARVKAGDQLLRFDLDMVARAAKSLMTPVLVTSMDGLALAQVRAAGPVKVGAALFAIRRTNGAPRANLAAAENAPTAGRHARLALPLGLHARPAALLAQRAKTFRSAVTISSQGRSANARSVVALMALGVRHGDPLEVRAVGEDAQAAADAILAALEAAAVLEAGAAGTPVPGVSPIRAASASTPTSAAGELGGTIAVRGMAIGRATRLERRDIPVIEAGAGIGAETARLEEALLHTRTRLARVAEAGGATRRDIIAAHLEFLDDPALRDQALAAVAAGKSAAFAWRAAVRRSIEMLETLADPRLRERADDLLDIESHVLLALAGEARPSSVPLPAGAVLLADDLLPSELTALERGHLAAICLARGGATSHVAILAGAMDLPMLVGLGQGIRAVADGTTVIVDAEAGRLQASPSREELERAEAHVHAALGRNARIRAAARAECRARDGTRIEIFANLGGIADAAAALAQGAEGCGLLRTEFLFLEREAAPTEAEQLAAYGEIAAALGGRPLVLRLMDVGGDKPLRYLPLPQEDNPALGLRGVRTLLAYPGLLRAQLAAALRVEPAGVVRLLVPMVTDLCEIRAVRTALGELAAERGLSPRIEIGAMIETPAAALTAAALAREVDFLSIGSNDLTQYTLAMDRGHPALAARADALHPAVLRLIASAGDAGRTAGKPVAVCGGVAGDAIAIPILLGLGVSELSMLPTLIPAAKARVRSLLLADCRELAARCLEASSADEVRALAAAALEGEPP